VRILVSIYYWLGLLSLPYILQLMFEMTFLTFLRGPQVLLFSISHGVYGIWSMVVILSMLAFYIFLFAGAIVTLILLFKRYREIIVTTKLIKILVSMYSFFVLAVTYGYWSVVFK